LPHFNYFTKTIDPGCTTQSLQERLQKLQTRDPAGDRKISQLFRSPNMTDIRKEIVTAKVSRLEHDMEILSELFDDNYMKRRTEEMKNGKVTPNTTSNFKGSETENAEEILRNQKKECSGHTEDLVNIKGAHKDKKYKPGGGEDLDEDKTIPKVSGCHWYGPLRLLIICYVDQEIHFYKIRGMVKSYLDIDRYLVKYKNPFLIEHSEIGIHKITKELIIVLVGQRQVLAIGADPGSKNFLQPINEGGKPKQLPQSQKKYYTLSGKASLSKDMMTSLVYDETLGIVITYFNGNFRMYDPFKF
jgi:hypothetical protein